MSTRVARSSYNDEAIPNITVEAHDLLQGQITTGRVFWLREVIVANQGAAAADLFLYDIGSETGVAPVATTQRVELYVPPLTTTKFTFSDPGILFKLGVQAATSAALPGTLAAYGITISGYEE